MADDQTVQNQAAAAVMEPPSAAPGPQATDPPTTAAAPQKPKAPSSRTIGPGFKIPVDQIDPATLQKFEVPEVHDRRQTEYESEVGYNKIAQYVIDVSREQLVSQQRDKVALRKHFAKLFSGLLILETVCLVIFILLDAITVIPVDLSDATLKSLISTVSTQVLATMGVMIAFAFVSKEETRIVGLLNQIVQNYQKVRLGDNGPDQTGSPDKH